jgi:2'-5' RNA ligase
MSESKRLFFAIELLPTIQRQIVRWRASQFPQEAGRPVAAANLHITLAFLGDVSAEKQRALASMAGRISQPGFTLHLDDAGQWLRSRVVWLGTRQPPRGLLQLANMLRHRPRAAVVTKARSLFIPHYPAARCQPCRGHSAAGFHWSFPVTTFALYESVFVQGRTRYTPLQRWTLGDT